MLRVCWRAIAITAFSSIAGCAEAHGGWDRGDPDVVIEWNELVQSVVPAGGLSPPRHYAMVHIAMFDAINSIQRSHRPYRTQVWAPRGASAEIAAAQAARDVLVAQFPASQATFDAALQARIDAVGAGHARTAIYVGESVAAAVLAWRQNDGWTTPQEPYALPTLPGFYQPTPPNFPPAAFRQFVDLKPFGLVTSTQYLPAPPPAVNSERYARDFEDVKALGSATSTVRTAEQTQLAQLMASVTSRTPHWTLWSQAARQIARENRLSLIETARLYALVNVSIHDGLQTSHTSKFIYGGWRPITAIRNAEDDLNPLTIGDATWTPLLTTPPYPSHAGNMACVSSSAARAMSLMHGSDEATFTLKWLGAPGYPDVSRQYTSFTQLAKDQADSRIYGGIHFGFESEVSQASCPKVAEYVFANYMRPLRHRD